MSKIVRKTNSSTGGPVFVDVDVEANGGKGKIVRVYPMDFTDDDPKSWVVEAKGQKFSPPRRTTYTAYTAGYKAMVHSKRRVLYPLKRIGFDVNGERNIAKRGEPGTPQAKTWVSLEPGWTVSSPPDHSIIEVQYDGIQKH